MSEWQPIETAPHDGTWMLLGYTQQGYEMPLGLFVGVGFIAPTDRVWVMNASDNEKSIPTHWMPLPEPPK